MEDPNKNKEIEPIHYVTLPTNDFIKEVEEIVTQAEQRGIILRILGGVAVYIHSKNNSEALSLYERIKRFGDYHPIFTDLDLVAYSKQRKEIVEYFEKILKFSYDPSLKLFATQRLIYYHPKGYYDTDIFFEKLSYSHDVIFGSKPGQGRLELDFPTISLADIVLEKLQIHKINLKDLIDLIILFYAHEIGETSAKEVIDGKYVSKILADDWGFWYDASLNLNKLKNIAEEFNKEGKLTPNEYNIVKERINKLIEMINKEPKTKNWIKREKIGTSKPWYKEVDEVVR